MHLMLSGFVQKCIGSASYLQAEIGTKKKKERK